MHLRFVLSLLWHAWPKPAQNDLLNIHPSVRIVSKHKYICSFPSSMAPQSNQISINSSNGLASSTWQIIASTNDDPLYRLIITSPDLNELNTDLVANTKLKTSIKDVHHFEICYVRYMPTSSNNSAVVLFSSAVFHSTLTLAGRGTHMTISKQRPPLVQINGFSPTQCKALTWTNAGSIDNCNRWKKI